MSSYIPHSVSILELAQSLQLGGTAPEEFERLYLQGVPIGVDWRSRPSVSEQDAFEILQRHLRGRQEFEELKAAYALYLDERNQERATKVTEAFQAELKSRRSAAGLRDPRLPGFPLGRAAGGSDPYLAIAQQEKESEAREYAQVAAREAGERFDERVPELDFQAWEKKHGRKVKVAA